MTIEITGIGTRVYRNQLGKLHRTDGPAVEMVNGHKEWRINGILHREDGPAVIFSSGRKEWFLNGVLQLDLKT